MVCVHRLWRMVLFQSSFRDQRVLLRIDNSVQIRIYVQLRPIKMLPVVEFHREQLRKCHLAKPGELPKTQEVLLPCDPKPKAMGGDVEHLNSRSAAANHL